MDVPITESEKQAWHAQAVDDVIRSAETDPQRGLTAEEVTRRREKHGPNALPETKRRSIWPVILRQFASPLIYILFVAAGIAFALGKHDDGIVILVVVLIN